MLTSTVLVVAVCVFFGHFYPDNTFKAATDAKADVRQVVLDSFRKKQGRPISRVDSFRFLNFLSLVRNTEPNLAAMVDSVEEAFVYHRSKPHQMPPTARSTANVEQKPRVKENVSKQIEFFDGLLKKNRSAAFRFYRSLPPAAQQDIRKHYPTIDFDFN